MKPKEKFELLKERYVIAFEKYNGYKPYKIWYENGYVRLQSTESISDSKHRVAEFERMMLTLESR